jgi:hypothetical protein
MYLSEIKYLKCITGLLYFSVKAAVQAAAVLAAIQTADTATVTAMTVIQTIVLSCPFN